jgi:DNA end-binding protein Ku
MSGPARWKGHLQFGQLRFEVVAKSAVREQRFSFNMHHLGCNGRLRQNGYVCESCGMLGIARDEVVKGYEGRAPLDLEYIESLEAERSTLINLDRLVPLSDVDPRLFQKSYDVTPAKGAEKPYLLVTKVLAKLGKAAVGKVVSGSEYRCVFRPRNNVLAMELLYWEDEVLASVEAEEAIAGVKISPEEMKLGEQLALALSGGWQSDAYKDEFREQVAEYLQRFLADEVLPGPVAAPKKPVQSDDLFAALTASVAAIEGTSSEEPKPKRKKSAA